MLELDFSEEPVEGLDGLDGTEVLVVEALLSVPVEVPEVVEEPEVVEDAEVEVEVAEVDVAEVDVAEVDVGSIGESEESPSLSLEIEMLEGITSASLTILKAKVETDEELLSIPSMLR